MKSILTILSLLVASLNLSAQCSVSITVLAADCSSCNGSAMANPTGQTPFSYSWSTSPVQTTQTATGLCGPNGIYTVTVTDLNSCTAVDSDTIFNVIRIDSIPSTPASCSTCCDGSATVWFVGGTPAFIYIWTPGISATNLCAGSQTVCITDMNGCYTCDTTTIGFTVSTENINEETFFEIFPNPSNGSFTVDFGKAINIKEIRLTDLLGNIILQQYANNQAKININNLPTGTYILTVIDKDNRTTHRKVIRLP